MFDRATIRLGIGPHSSTVFGLCGLADETCGSASSHILSRAVELRLRAYVV